MFKRASRKLGLSQAVFESGTGVAKSFSGGAGGDDGDGDGEGGGGGEMSVLLDMDKDKIEALLRFGAYAIMDEEESNAAAAAFQNSTIDQASNQEDGSHESGWL